jgi:N-dimethylarginine dimethylaminohydrolase
MAKPNRRAEPKTIADELATQGFPVSSCIEPPGTLEGGDVVWLDDRLCAIGLSYRTNLAGYEQFGALCSEDIEFLPVHLPHFRGPGVILHLSSLLSVVAQKVVLADIEYLPVSFLAELAQRGIAVLSIPESERSTLAANVLSIGNDTLISISGNARTQALLRSEGFSVIPVHGNQISILGDGGPTCLTRPLAFDAS